MDKQKLLDELSLLEVKKVELVEMLKSIEEKIDSIKKENKKMF